MKNTTDSKKDKKPLSQGIKKKLVRSVIKVAERPLLYSFIIFLIVLAIGGILFYQYIFLAQRKETDLLTFPVLLEEETYQKILRGWQEQESKFNEADTKSYLNPF